MPVTKKQRTKCFTGCWTCRSRRVKCDEETPKCLRCRQMGLECEGYGIRLTWVPYNPHTDDDHGSVDDLPRDGRASRRSLPSFGAAPVIVRMTSPDIDESLTRIDAWYPGESSVLNTGAFSVFPVTSSGQGLSQPDEPHFPESDRARLNFLEYSTTPINTPGQLSAATLAHTPGEATDAGEATSYPPRRLWEGSVTAQPTPDAARVQDCGTLTDTEFSLRPVSHNPSDYHIREEVDQTSQNAAQDVSHQRLVRGPSRHLDAMPMPSKQKRLIHHWVTFTSRKIVLLDEPHNPCRTMMLPMALKGLVSMADDSNADVAIFHAICSAAAYNLFELSGRTTEQDHVLALHHDGEAIRHLRHNLARADEHQGQSCAMAIMACIAVEAVSGTTQRWRTHVSGGLAYLSKLQARGVDEMAVSAFRQHMVKMAILCDFPVTDDLKSFLRDDGGSAIDLEFTFPYYGVSRSTLQAHDRINTLIAASSNKTPPLEGEVDAFELQLYLQFPGLPAQVFSSEAKREHAAVVHHTSAAFYYAGLIFFQRSIRCSPVAAVQELVELGVQELENIEVAGKGKLGCMMLWPALVLGAECNTVGSQRRMRAWFRSQRKLGFRNLVVLEDLITSLWSDRADPYARVEEADWQSFVASPWSPDTQGKPSHAHIIAERPQAIGPVVDFKKISQAMMSSKEVRTELGAKLRDFYARSITSMD
ncbi:hypothetical protein KVR01_008977 [Diaporthe batatas]|uniref:uncharacterized protein n=1 Tax=Diaporthe batatas TaxID=748121 RepID=UPI001D05359C|nr:uncharacterized protein KVR01_008977 [Diaporthe batatas]KAG8160713.1 hypothetical protein KVR01_008977 [Diaporthe batatas]